MGKEIKILPLLFVSLFLFTPLGHKATAQNWPGVDETVVERFAEEGGRKAWTPFINTDQGDLLLFVFLLAGALGGFVMGYYWRVLFSEKKEDSDE